MSPLLSTFAGASALAYGFTRGATTPAGSYELISTATPNAVSGFSFTSIPATYTHLQIRATVRSNYSSPNMGLAVTFNGDTATNYSSHLLSSTGSTPFAGATATTSSFSGLNHPSGMSTANTFSSFIFDILDYANTNKYKTSKIYTGYHAGGSTYGLTWNSVSWRSTAAINQITFNVVVGSYVTGTRFSLYGIKGA